MRHSVTDKRTLILLHSITDLKGKTKCLRKYTRAITISLAMFSDDKKKIFFFHFIFIWKGKCIVKVLYPNRGLAFALAFWEVISVKDVKDGSIFD